MTSKRIVLTAVAVVIVIFTSSIVQSWLFDVGHLEPVTDSFGPVKLTSPALDIPGSPVALTSDWSGDSTVVQYNWKDATTQKLLGPLRVAVLWTTRPPRAWLRTGSVCSFIFRYFETVDGVAHVPGFDALTMRNVHICMCNSQADGRSWFYAYTVPDPRCRTNALVFWKVPWTLASDAPGAEEINAQLDGGMKARAMTAVIASLDPGIACQHKVRWSAHVLIITLLVGAACVIALLMLIYRHSI